MCPPNVQFVYSLESALGSVSAQMGGRLARNPLAYVAV
jgi:hypothetical protein